MKKTIIWILVFISLLALFLRFSNKFAEIFLGIKQTSGISILSEPKDATVFLDEKEVGKTPFEDKNLEVREYKVRITSDGASWEGKVSLNEGTVTVVNRDLSKDQSSSAGETLSLQRGKGITLISNPSSADIEIDGKAYNQTPVTVDVESGEHTILVSHQNFLKRSIKADLPKGFNLVISTDLALSEADLTTISTPVINQTPEVVVKQTPTGFLRVRDKPSLLGKEIAQVKPGDKLVLLEEAPDWDRVRLSDNTEGYVSAVYVEKQTP